jgi:DNA ligase-1
MNLPTLYGRATNGKIKQYAVSVLRMGDGTAYIEKEHGYVTGKKQIDSRLISEGKNLGKSNETDCYEQACSEAQSAFERKKDSGYVEDQSNIPKESDGLFLPMLAHRYDKHPDKISFPCWGQPKLDGVRMLARKENGTVTMWSRKGKLIDIPDKINDQLCTLLSDGECTDGELYVHGWTFQRVISAVKKKRDDTDLLEYHIYDRPHETGTFEDRFVNTETTPPSQIKFVQTKMLDTSDELDRYEERVLADGYEGLMARNCNSLYKFKNRSYDLMKVKRFQDAEYKIVNFTDGDGREAECIVYRCVTDSGLEFGVRPQGTHEARARAFEDGQNYIGKYLTVKFFELTEDGIPRFPVGICVRDYE